MKDSNPPQSPRHPGGERSVGFMASGRYNSEGVPARTARVRQASGRTAEEGGQHDCGHRDPG